MLALGSILAGLLAAAAPATAAAGPLAPVELVPLRGQPYARFSVRDGLGRDVVAYLDEAPAGVPALPLVLYVQGSGCTSHFTRREGGWTPRNGHMGVLEAARGRARVLLVEKPGVLPGDDPKGPAETAGRPEFRREHTLEHWVEALSTALDAALRAPGVDPSRVLVVGHSEGGLVACRLARRRRDVTHVALLAGGGPTQLFDLVALARRGWLMGHVSDPEARVAELLARWRNVLAHPDDAERLFLGHAHRRWTSFLSTSPVEELREVSARVLVAQGQDDRAVEPASADVLVAALRARGADVTELRLAGADHSFRLTDAPDRDGWGEVLGRVVAWFLAPPPR